MEDPLRLKILKRLCEYLGQEIKVSNGYYTDLGDNDCFRGRIIFGDGDPIPMLSLVETPNPIIQEQSSPVNSVSKGQYPLYVQGWVADDYKNPTDPAHYLLADVKRALSKIRERPSDAQPGNFQAWNLDNLVSDIVIGQGIARPAEDMVSNKAFFWLDISLEIVENLDTPYAPSIS